MTSSSLSQNVKNKVKYQIHLEDSSKVYWYRYPEPFSHPAYLDRKVLSQALSFYCELPGKLEIGLMCSNSDSIVFKFSTPSTNSRRYTFWPWTANQFADIKRISPEYYQNNSDMQLKLALMLDGRIKCIYPLYSKIPEGSYFYLQWAFKNKFNKIGSNLRSTGRGKQEALIRSFKEN